MELLVKIPEPLIKEVKRIHDNDTTRTILESKHELSAAYASIVLNVFKAYEDYKK